MKDLKFIFVFSLCSLFIFYVGIVLIEGTFIINDMDKSTRQIVFGSWVGLVIMGAVGYFLDKEDKRRQL
jgi:hypothetical protein